MDATDRSRRATFRLALGAVGVVFGDIGTSPLYTMKEAFSGHYGLRPVDADVLGVLSLVFWSLMLVVTFKYVMLMMRADNRGEGGILALMALAQRKLPLDAPTAYAIGILGIFGVALFFGDAVITPAISILGAIEGLEVATPAFAHTIVPITIGILVGLALIQSRGTEALGRVMGPITALWFIVIAVFGVAGILDSPRVLNAVNPLYATAFVAAHGTHAFFVLGAVVLAVTGAEALYADIGHFGKQPIRLAWLWFVFPALVLNYFGQGALLLEHPETTKNPFYELVPKWALYPTIALATSAAVFASQAVISGAYSLARQAMQLGYLPRLRVRHTSETAIGQIYVPGINRLLLVSVVAVVLGFGSSTALASAYGVAVTGTMFISTVLLLVVMRAQAAWPSLLLFAVFAFLFVVDVAFFGANAIKFADGAWFPLVLGVVVFTLMRTWKRGRQLLVTEVRRISIEIDPFLRSLDASPPLRAPGTAIFMTATNDRIPLALLHNLKHNKVLHERNILLTVATVSNPRAEPDERAKLVDVGPGFQRLTLRFGFMEEPDVPKALREIAIAGLPADLDQASYFASRETLIASRHKGMPIWRDWLYLIMARNTVGATVFYRIPGNRLVELGTQVEI